MKRVKLLIIFPLIYLLMGCESKAISSNYEKTKMTSDNINGYKMDLRIYGTDGQNNYNETVKIDCCGKDFKITIVDNKAKEIVTTEEETINKKERTSGDTIIYIKDDKAYIETNNKYEEITNVKYRNPAIYLEGSNYIKKNSKFKEEIIGNNTYKVYSVSVDKDIVSKILEDANIAGLTLKENVKADVYLDADGYVYRIIYYVDTITINASYYGINTTSAIDIELIK